ncbi:hypothetical protein Bca4012_063533 [Brassica carinata]|uniref:Uncharacterized protein n=1 Tax=Brassica carinata TaxID=52824 RepID=A0A8X7V6Z6_BRACI|nr:hypothetical protein Bca52824_033123 [Brassica carinata]
MDVMSLNNDDDYVSDNGDSEQEMDKNNLVVDESLMSTAEVKGGCDLDEEDVLDEEEEEGVKKKTRLN